MSILFRRAGQQRRGLGDTPAQLVPLREASTYSGTGNVAVTSDTALRMSAVWACLWLRANIVRATPMYVTRLSQGVPFRIPNNFVENPGGSTMLAPDWRSATQFDLGRYGNVFGYKSAYDGLGNVAEVELWDTCAVTPIIRWFPDRGMQITSFWYGNERYDPREVWHERDRVVPGVPIGLSPLAYAAYSIGGYLSAQQFALNWFANGAFPAGTLRNVEESEIPDATRKDVKKQFKAAVANNDIFVTGAEWEFSFNNVDSQTAGFLSEMSYGIGDIARFLDVPGDMIGAETSTGSVTYANVTQRMLQALITSFGSMFVGREAAFTAAIPKKQTAQFDRHALLQMDPETFQKVLNGQILSRQLAPSEARRENNRPPFTPEQIAEFDMLQPPVATIKAGSEVA